MSVALFVLQRLGNFTANQAAGNGFGQFLMQLGFGDASAAKLDEIQSTLNEINSKLDALQKSVAELRARVENLNCNRSQDKPAVAEAAIENVWKSFDRTVADAKTQLANKPEQQKLSKKLIDRINDEFRQLSPAGAVTLIHNTLLGTTGSSSMIADCGVAYQEASGNFITSQLHDRVAVLVDYWQLVEAQAAVMNIGLLVDKGEETDAKAARQDAESNLATESAKIKPSLENMVLDKGTNLVWTKTAVAPIKFASWQSRSPGSGWRLPNSDELRALVRLGYGSMSGVDWLRKQTPFVIPSTPNTTLALISSSTLPWKPGKPDLALDLNTGDKSVIKVQVNQPCYALFISSARGDKYLYTS